METVKSTLQNEELQKQKNPPIEIRVDVDSGVTTIKAYTVLPFRNNFTGKDLDETIRCLNERASRGYFQVQPRAEMFEIYYIQKIIVSSLVGSKAAIKAAIGDAEICLRGAIYVIVNENT